MTRWRMVALPSFVLTPESRAFGMGVFYTIFHGAMVLMPALAGWLADRTANAGTTFVLGAMMLLACAGGLGLFRRIAAPALPAA